MQESKGIRFRDPRFFSVEILHITTGASVGTGFIVLKDGLINIVTCKHVLKAAGLDPHSGKPIPGLLESVLGKTPNADTNIEVPICFEFERDNGAPRRHALLEAIINDYGDDVVLLRLVGERPVDFYEHKHSAVLGSAEPQRSFYSFGYSQLPFGADGVDTRGWPAEGSIVGHGTNPRGMKFRAKPVLLKSDHIDEGMSGAAVVDIDRNLVVGIIEKTLKNKRRTRHKESSTAVDAWALLFIPFDLPMREIGPPKDPPPELKTDIQEAQAMAKSHLGIAWNTAPDPLPEWVERKDLLRLLSTDWSHHERRISALIGFGGEGKTSLARHWTETLLTKVSQSQLDGVFWWSFYYRPNVDEFLAKAFNFLSGNDEALFRKYPNASAQVRYIAGMLTSGRRYLFILDGLEVLQYQNKEKFGYLRRSEITEFLEYLADSRNRSFCLITTRTPIFDLITYTGTIYIPHSVERLTLEEGRTLLRNIGVKAPDSTLDRIVQYCYGHALSLGLIGAYLAAQEGNMIERLEKIPPLTDSDTLYGRVHRILDWYDQHLSEAERAFLMIFSAFRLPVREDAFATVFRAEDSRQALNAPLAALDDSRFNTLLTHLRKKFILRYYARARIYTAHPLIREFYSKQLNKYEHSRITAVHTLLKEYYLSSAGPMPLNPTLDDLTPLFEAVHHACRAGSFAEAYYIYLQQIEQNKDPMIPERVLTYKLGAYNKDLELVGEFFPDGDLSREPQVTEQNAKYYLLNEVGLCLMTLGQLKQALPYFERGIDIALKIGDIANASKTYQNIAELQIHLGRLKHNAEPTQKGLDLARQASALEREWRALGYQAWDAHVRGELEFAGVAFRQAEEVHWQFEQKTERHKKCSQQGQHLEDLWGVWHADHLRRIGDRDFARLVTEGNMEMSKYDGYPEGISQCHRVLGDLDADEGNEDSARSHYDEALAVARRIFQRQVLIEALLGRGRWAARCGKVEMASSDLEEALKYAGDSEYRLFEVDIHVALAWMYWSDGKLLEAQANAKRGLVMSEEMGYYWGRLDANEILAKNI